MRLAPYAVDLDPHLEEINLRLVAGIVDERDEGLGLAEPSLPEHGADGRLADRKAFLDEFSVQAGPGHPLLRGGPRRPLREQLLDPFLDGLRDRLPSRNLTLTDGFRLLQVLSHRIARHAEIPRHRSNRHLLHQHLVSDHVH